MFRLLIALAVLFAALLVTEPWGGGEGAGEDLSKMEILGRGEAELLARGISPASAACIVDGADREFSEEELQDAGEAFGESVPDTVGEMSPAQLAVIAKVTQIGIACGSSP